MHAAHSPRSRLARLGRMCALHPWRALAAWVLIIALLAGGATTVGGSTRDDWNVDGIESQRGIDMLRAHTPGLGNASTDVVVHSREGARLDAADLTALGTRMAAMPHAARVEPPRLSKDGDTAVTRVWYDLPATDPTVREGMGPLQRATDTLRAKGLQVEFGGDVPMIAQQEMSGRGEMLGVITALVILLVTFGSVVAAGLPIATALVGLVAGMLGITILAGHTAVSPFAPTVASMVGLGVGIDYALLMLMRMRELRAKGLDAVDAASGAVATAGRTVTFAGVTVLVSLMGLPLAGLPTYQVFGVTTAMTVLMMIATALTALPALAVLAGDRILSRRVRRGTTASTRTRSSEPSQLRAPIRGVRSSRWSSDTPVARWAAVRKGRARWDVWTPST